MTRRDRDAGAELPRPELDARIQAGLREVGSQHVPGPDWQSQVHARITRAEADDAHRAARNAKLWRAMWWVGPIAIAVAGFVTVALILAFSEGCP